MSLKHRLFWMIPIAIVLAGIGTLFFQSISEVSEPPEKDWSRELTIGQTSTNNYPYIHSMEDDKIEIVEFNNDTLVNKVYDSSFNLVEEHPFSDIPVDKWTRVYIEEGELIYFDFQDIYDSSGDHITEADTFHALNNTLLYTLDDAIYRLNATSKNSTLIKKLETDYDKIIPIETEQGIYFLSYLHNSNKLHTSVYRFVDEKVEQIVENTFSIPYNQTIQEASLAANGQEIAFIVKSKTKGTGGNSPISKIYLYTSENGTFQELVIADPKGDRWLSDINDVSITYIDQQLRLLFNARGLTDTKYRTTTGFNIYEAFKEESGFDVYRRSNTADLSTKPQWIDSNTVTWIEVKNETNPIRVSSNDEALINKTDKVNRDDLMNALGKTLGMLSATFFALILAALWAIGPILFLILIFISQRKLLDTDPAWIYYAGLLSYIISFLIFKDQFFIDSIYNTAPYYLTFTYSSYVYFALFGLISYLSTQLGEKSKEWSSPVKLFYFILVHIGLTSFFFGPYIM